VGVYGEWYTGLNVDRDGTRSENSTLLTTVCFVASYLMSTTRILRAPFSSRILRPRHQCSANYLCKYRATNPHRSFVTTKTTRAALATHPPGQSSVIVLSPSPAQIEQQDLEVELIPPEEVRVEVTERAAEACPSTCSCEFHSRKRPFFTATS
jgi:ferredoxin